MSAAEGAEAFAPSVGDEVFRFEGAKQIRCRVEKVGEHGTARVGGTTAWLPFAALRPAPRVTEAEEAAARMDAHLLLLEEESSWEPMTAWEMLATIRNETPVTEPTLLERADGVRLLYPGTINLFLGEPEGCKSWATLVVAAEELGRGNCVLMVDCEDSFVTMAERLRQLGVADEAVADRLVYCQPSGPFDDVAMAHLKERIYSMSADLTFAAMDSMTEAMSLEDLDPDRGVDVSRFYHGAPRWLTSQGASVVIVDHVTKTPIGRGKWAIGSERKISGLDGAAYAFKATRPFGRGLTGHVELTVSKDRRGYVRRHEVDGKIGVLILESDPESELVSWRLAVPMGDGDRADAKAEAARLSVYSVVEANEGINSTDLRAAAVGETGDVRDAMSWLRANGHVATKGKSPVLHFAAVPYPPEDE